jgi:hypothetical protein
MKRILFLIIILFLFSGIALGYELGAGSGTGYPAEIDTDTSVEVDYPDPLATTARAAVPNDTNAAVIAIETELGINPSGAYDTVKARLDAGFGELSFTDLDDTPANYTGQANKYTKVNAGETALEFGTIDLSLYYLKTEIDSLGDVEAIYVKDITDSDELAAALGAYYLKTDINTIGKVETIWVKDIIDSDELAALKFTDLADTPAAYDNGKYAKSTADGVVWDTPAGGGASTFLELTDTPADYTGGSLKFVRVNEGETALEFAAEADPTVDTDAEIKAILVDEVTKMGSFIAERNAIIYDASGIISQGTNTDTEIATAVTRSHIRNEDTKIQFYNALTSDHSYSGLEDIQPVGESVVFGDLLYFNWTDKEWKKAKADIAQTMPGLRIALETKTDSQDCKMLVKGYIRDDSAFEFTGPIVHVSAATAGAMTSTAPSTAGNQLQRVGVAKSADILFFDPSIDVGEIKP